MMKRPSRKGVTAFLLLAFGIAWVAWVVPLLLGAALQSPRFKIAVFIGTFGPAVACFVVRKWVTREGFADAGLRLNLRRWPFYALALLIPLAVATAITLIAPAIGAGQPNTAQALAALVPAAFHAPNSLTSWFGVIVALLVASIVFTPILWGEEFGWRGYLQLRLYPGRPLLAAIATGTVWGVWHYPLLLLGTELPQHPILVLILFPLGTVFYSVLFGWLRMRSGSTWAPSLAHSAFDNMRSPLVAALFAAQSDKLNLSFISVVLSGIVAVAVLVASERKPAVRSA